MEGNKAYFVRQRTSGGDWSQTALEESKIFIGWNVPGLIETNSFYEMREVLKNAIYPTHENYRAAGNATSHMWGFIKDITVGTLVVIPYASGVAIGEAVSECKYRDDWVEQDRAYYRDIKWLTSEPISRTEFDNAIQRAMSGYGTVVNLSQYYKELNDTLNNCLRGEKNTIKNDIEEKVYPLLLEQLIDGKVNNYDFERIIKKLFEKRGCEAILIPRSKDIGTDIKCKFTAIPSLEIPMSVQVKQYAKGTTVKKEVVEKLLMSMKDETNVGIIVTTGELDEEAQNYIADVNNAGDYSLGFIGGKDLCRELVSTGIFPDFDLE